MLTLRIEGEIFKFVQPNSTGPSLKKINKQNQHTHKTIPTSQINLLKEMISLFWFVHYLSALKAEKVWCLGNVTNPVISVPNFFTF